MGQAYVDILQYVATVATKAKLNLQRISILWLQEILVNLQILVLYLFNDCTFSVYL